MTLGLSPQPPQRFAPVVIPQDVPVYKVTDEKGFFGPNDTLFPADSLIVFMDEPNPAMEPMNSMADEIYRKYLAKLDKEGRKVANKNGTAYMGLTDAFEQSRTMFAKEARTIELLGGKTIIPLMGAKKKEGRVSAVELNSGSSKPILTVAKEKDAVNSTGELVE